MHYVGIFLGHLFLVGIVGPWLGATAICSPMLLYAKEFAAVDLVGLIFVGAFGVVLCWWIVLPLAVISFLLGLGADPLFNRYLGLGSMILLGLAMGVFMQWSPWDNLVIPLIGLGVGLAINPLTRRLWRIAETPTTHRA